MSRVVVDPTVLGGVPVIRGSRVPVDLVVGSLRDGLEVPEVAAAFGIDVEDVLAAAEYAAVQVEPAPENVDR